MGRGTGGNASNLMYGSVSFNQEGNQEDDDHYPAEITYQRWLDEGKRPTYFQASRLAESYLIESIQKTEVSDQIKKSYKTSSEYRRLNDCLSQDIPKALQAKQKSMPRYERIVLRFIHKEEKEKIGGIDQHPLSVSLANKRNATSLGEYLASFDQYTIGLLNYYQKMPGDEFPAIIKMIADQTVDLILEKGKLEKLITDLDRGFKYNQQGVSPQKVFNKENYAKYKQKLGIDQIVKLKLFNRQAPLMIANISSNKEIVEELQTVIFNHCQNYEKLKEIPRGYFYTLAHALLSKQDSKRLQELTNSLRSHAENIHSLSMLTKDIQIN